jgi:plasmid stabilization system protein ParE
MSYRYILHELAQQDYDTVVAWYAARSSKAAENLITEVEHALQLICDNPGRWRNGYKYYRELGVTKYPYVIIYSIEEDKQLVIITAFFHTSRNPKKKYRKT